MLDIVSDNKFKRKCFYQTEQVCGQEQCQHVCEDNDGVCKQFPSCKKAIEDYSSSLGKKAVLQLKEFEGFGFEQKSARVGAMRMTFEPKWVNKFKMPEADTWKNPGVQPSQLLLKRGKTIQVKFKTKRWPANSKFPFRRSIFFDDGWDIFESENVQIQSNFNGWEKFLKVQLFQNPLLQLFIGKYTSVFSAGQRRKSVHISLSDQLNWGSTYFWSWSLQSSGHWHEWFLDYQKLFNYSAEKWKESGPRQETTPNGCPVSPYKIVRKKGHCAQHLLVSFYQEMFYLEMPEPGYMKIGTFDRWRFGSMQLGGKACGHLEAKLEYWPKDSKKWYAYAQVTLVGANGGLRFSKDKYSLLRFPRPRKGLFVLFFFCFDTMYIYTLIQSIDIAKKILLI